MFKGLSNLGALLKSAQQLGSRVQELNEALKSRRATGSAGGGMVEVELNGLLEVLRCRIDPQLMAQNDRELVEDLVAAAVNQAIGKGRQLHAEAMKELTGGLALPGIQEVIEKFGSAAEPEKP
jgi:nucleoid-associated protein EbfC